MSKILTTEEIEKLIEQEGPWTPVPLNPVYFISKSGMVYNSLTGNFLSQTPGSDGYVSVCLPGNHTQRIHRLQLANLIASGEIHHIDGDKTNNDLDNLALVTVAAHNKLHKIMRKAFSEE